jgi:hypothetical protein
MNMNASLSIRSRNDHVLFVAAATSGTLTEGLTVLRLVPAAFETTLQFVRDARASKPVTVLTGPEDAGDKLVLWWAAHAKAPVSDRLKFMIDDIAELTRLTAQTEHATSLQLSFHNAADNMLPFMPHAGLRLIYDTQPEEPSFALVPLDRTAPQLGHHALYVDIVAIEVTGEKQETGEAKRDTLLAHLESYKNKLSARRDPGASEISPEYLARIVDIDWGLLAEDPHGFLEEREAAEDSSLLTSPGEGFMMHAAHHSPAHTEEHAEESHLAHDIEHGVGGAAAMHMVGHGDAHGPAAHGGAQGAVHGTAHGATHAAELAAETAEVAEAAEWHHKAHEKIDEAMAEQAREAENEARIQQHEFQEAQHILADQRQEDQQILADEISEEQALAAGESIEGLEALHRTGEEVERENHETGERVERLNDEAGEELTQRARELHDDMILEVTKLRDEQDLMAREVADRLDEGANEVRKEMALAANEQAEKAAEWYHQAHEKLDEAMAERAHEVDESGKETVVEENTLNAEEQAEGVKQLQESIDQAQEAAAQDREAKAANIEENESNKERLAKEAESGEPPEREQESPESEEHEPGEESGQDDGGQEDGRVENEDETKNDESHSQSREHASTDVGHLHHGAYHSLRHIATGAEGTTGAEEILHHMHAPHRVDGAHSLKATAVGNAWQIPHANGGLGVTGDFRQAASFTMRPMGQWTSTRPDSSLSPASPFTLMPGATWPPQILAIPALWPGSARPARDPSAIFAGHIIDNHALSPRKDIKMRAPNFEHSFGDFFVPPSPAPSPMGDL